MELAEYLGIQPRWTDSTQTGGSSFEIHVEHAAAAIALGLCDVAVIVYARTPRSDRKRGRRRLPAAARRWASRPWPSGSCPTACACRWARTRSPPAGTWPSSARPRSSSPRSRSSTREWAAMNPRARLQEPITVDDVLASPIEASPLHKLDCCLVTDGAGAVVMTSAERARDLAQAAGPTCSAPAPATPTT